ncbi:glycosyltransferase family 2 protein [Bacillus sp. NPDC094106]|uniref:glycosyltransferase family 2 protein n=1 Tax=Bacillus sp. NPDC094106 TaxID=3363949 RepID=UPI003802D9C8
MLISVITAVYNDEDYLQECIDSILNQTYKDFEYIIVNDGSTDSTSQILDTIADPRVRVVHLEKNQGVSFARNVAIGLAKGDWIAIQDADDISLPNRLEEQIKYVKMNSDIVAVFSMIECISGNIPVDENNLKEIERYHNGIISSEQIMNARFEGCPVCVGTALASKKVLVECGGYDTTLGIGEDYDLFVMRMFEVGQLEVVPKVLYQRRIDPYSVSHTDILKTQIQVNIVSLRGIRKICYSMLEYTPALIVIGTSDSCENFKGNVAPFVDFTVREYCQNGAVFKNIKQLFNEKQIDGIVILDGYDTYHLLASLTRIRGIEFNKNLFVLWNEV